MATKAKAAPPSKANNKYRKLPPQPSGEPEPLTLYDYDEAGAFLRMTGRQVKDRVEAGTIGYVRHGRRRLILGRQIIAYISDNEFPPLSRRGRRGGS
jgi:hypothetical protein